MSLYNLLFIGTYRHHVPKYDIPNNVIASCGIVRHFVLPSEASSFGRTSSIATQ